MFKERVITDMNEENILFYEAFQKLRISCTLHQIVAIYETFIELDAPYELNISECLRQSTKAKLDALLSNQKSKLTSNIYDEVAIEVETMLFQNSFPRFIDSCMGSEFTLNVASSKKTLVR